LFKLFKFRRQPLVRGERFAQTHEGTHDIHADFDRAGGIQNRGRHERAVFGERKWRAAQSHFCARIGHHKL
jgi:hypothetical protein